MRVSCSRNAFSLVCRFAAKKSKDASLKEVSSE